MCKRNRILAVQLAMPATLTLGIFPAASPLGVGVGLAVKPKLHRDGRINVTPARQPYQGSRVALADTRARIQAVGGQAGSSSPVSAATALPDPP